MSVSFQKARYSQWRLYKASVVVDHSVTVLASGRLLDLGCATAFVPFLMSCFFAGQVLTQLDLLTYWKVTATYKNEVYFLPNQLDEKMAITPPCVS